MAYDDLRPVLQAFRFEGGFIDAQEIPSGNINNTFHLYYRAPDGSAREYLLQQINTYVFKKPEEVMSNVRRVTEHLERATLRAGQDPARRVLRLIPTTDGQWMYRDGQNRCWRAYDYITGAVAYDRPEKPEHFMEAGRAFGRFQKMLSDFPAGELYETIPNFHNTRRRFYDFVASVAQDRAGRVKGLEKEIDFFFDRRKLMSRIVDMIEDGVLPLRVTHNDTKMNNVMLDAATGKGLCVIDLDTVMPGSALYDFGDAVRAGASTAAEDEPDTDKIALDMNLYRAFAQGFVSESGDSMTDAELRLLPLSVEVMTCELAMRFLTDYIDGDIYFKICCPEHNLIRAHAQMKLLTDVEAKYDRLCEITAQFAKK